MQYKTQGVVLFTSQYSDTFSIAHVFTRDFGRMAYLLPKSSGKKSKIKASLFFPLSVLNMEVEHLPLREIQRLKEVEREFPLYEICTDEVKISISFFLSEFLSKMLRETHESKPLFDYLKQSVHILEKAHRGLGNFHLAFMFGLTRFLGISPNLDNYRSGAYFDLLNGIFVQQIPSHPH
ncbi:MAG: recombination protein O N-terminal domain-containing protein, partial [Dysgonamonadaceae bacterium]